MRLRVIAALVVAVVGAGSYALIVHAGRGTNGPNSAPVDWEVETIARGLTVPWGLAISRDGSIFFSERTGRLSVIDRVGELLEHRGDDGRAARVRQNDDLARNS